MIFKLLRILLLTLLTAAAFLTFQFLHFATQPLPLPSDGATVEIRSGSGLTTIANTLHQQKIIDEPLAFRLLAKLLGEAGQLQAGEFFIPPETTPIALLQILTSGRVVQHQLTIIEGWNFRQLLNALADHPAITQTLPPEWRTAPLEEMGDEILVALKLPPGHPEGRFLADTYHFPRGTSDADFLRRAYREMERLLATEWEKRDPQTRLQNPEEALILASIIEKETGRGEERTRIAGVFNRRMQRNMRLQTDPTVIYGMGDRYQGRIRRADLQRDTPYNTYTRHGLPITPIAMPGPAAIRAALHPEPGNSLYFVSRGDGSHHFSATLEEHNRAVRKYILGTRL